MESIVAVYPAFGMQSARRPTTPFCSAQAADSSCLPPKFANQKYCNTQCVL